MSTEHKDWMERSKELSRAASAAEYALMYEAYYLATMFSDDPRLNLLREKVAGWKAAEAARTAFIKETLASKQEVVNGI